MSSCVHDIDDRTGGGYRLVVLAQGFEIGIDGVLDARPNLGLRVAGCGARVLFEVSGSVIIVWRVVHRSEAYE